MKINNDWLYNLGLLICQSPCDTSHTTESQTRSFSLPMKIFVKHWLTNLQFRNANESVLQPHLRTKPRENINGLWELFTHQSFCFSSWFKTSHAPSSLKINTRLPVPAFKVRTHLYTRVYSVFVPAFKARTNLCITHSKWGHFFTHLWTCLTHTKRG